LGEPDYASPGPARQPGFGNRVCPDAGAAKPRDTSPVPRTQFCDSFGVGWAPNQHGEFTMRLMTKLLAGTGIALIGAGALAGIAAADGRGGWGGHRGGATQLFDQFDGDKDGRVTQDEIQTQRNERLTRFDANADGILSLEEYQALWADAMRREMVRAFQRHDTDGDARVTPEEFSARFQGMVERLDGDGDGAVTRDELRQRMERHHGGRHGGPHGDRGGDDDRDDDRG
jgi:Ca2+-binding EF-hand superfamily protein